MSRGTKLLVSSCALWLISTLGCAMNHTIDQLIELDVLRTYYETAGYNNGLPTAIEITPDGGKVLFLRSGPRDRVQDLFEMDAATGDVRKLVGVEDILKGAAEELSPEEIARRERMRQGGQGITSYQLSNDGEHILISLSGRLYVVGRADGVVTALPDSDKGPAIDPKFSPDGTYVSCVRGHDVYAMEWRTGREWAVTTGGTADVTHGLAEFVAAEEMGRYSGYWWSGDSRSIAFEEADLREVEVLRIADPFHPENAPQPWRYPRAGTANAKVRLAVVPIEGGTPRWVDWDRDRFPYMATVKWGKDAPLTVLVQNREQTEQVLYKVDPVTAKPTEILRETDDAWLNIREDMPRWLTGGTEFLWLTERTGRWVLELRADDGRLIRELNTGEERLDGVAGVWVKNGRRGVVVRGGTNPTEVHLFSIGLDRREALLPRTGPAEWGLKVSDNWATVVFTRSGMDGVRSEVICDGNKSSHEIPSVAESPPYVPNVELTTVESDGRSFHSAIIRPRVFRGRNKYPVLVRVYGGPGHNVVTANALRQRYHRDQWLADQGFIIVSFDGRGTPRRGRAWERAIKGNFIDIPLADQAAALAALGERVGEMDLSRVGIYGWSFGGYFSCMAVTKRPDVFHAAVAGAPVVDWLDYDTHYTERFLGVPQDNPEAYRASDVLTDADDLRRPLLLIHGTADDNVYFLHSLKLADRLMRKGRPFELLPLVGFTHSPRDPDVNVRVWERTAGFFKEHLQRRRPAPTRESP